MRHKGYSLCQICFKMLTEDDPPITHGVSVCDWCWQNYNGDSGAIKEVIQKKEKKVTEQKKKKVVPSGKPRKHKAMKSLKEVKKDQLKKEVGELRDGEKWEARDLDMLFDLFLDAHCSIHGICKELKRSPSSIETILWKVATGYTPYTAQAREDRQGKEWTPRELTYLQQMWEAGLPVASMCEVLVRSRESVVGKIGTLKTQNRPTLFDLSGKEPVPTQPNTQRKTIKEHEGKKYVRRIYGLPGTNSGKSKSGRVWVEVDVYCVLDAFEVEDNPVGHAIKKLLCAGTRGKGDRLADLNGVIAAINRAIEEEEHRRQEESDANSGSD